MGVRACVDGCRFVLNETTICTIVDPFCGWGTWTTPSDRTRSASIGRRACGVRSRRDSSEVRS
jgi:hypothetical protein